MCHCGDGGGGGVSPLTALSFIPQHFIHEYETIPVGGIPATSCKTGFWNWLF